MAFTILWFVFLAWLIALVLGSKFISGDINRTDRIFTFSALWWFCLTVIALGISLVATGIMQQIDNEAGAQTARVARLYEQRDAMISEIEENLSADQYRILVSAIPDDVDDLRVWFGRDASNFLLGKVDRILALNERVYEIDNERFEKYEDACAYINNPFTPRLPFGVGMPECRLVIDHDIGINAPEWPTEEVDS